MAFLLTCPVCGRRDLAEFTFGGQAGGLGRGADAAGSGSLPDHAPEQPRAPETGPAPEPGPSLEPDDATASNRGFARESGSAAATHPDSTGEPELAAGPGPALKPDRATAPDQGFTRGSGPAPTTDPGSTREPKPVGQPDPARRGDHKLHFRRVQFRSVPRGAVEEWWHHGKGCGLWFKTRRDTTTNRETGG